MAAGSYRRRRRKPLDGWRILSSILSAVFMTLGLFLILMAVAEVLVYAIDASSNGTESYQGWWSTPLLMVLMSIPFFIGFLIVNLNRFRWYHRVKEKLSFNFQDTGRKEKGRMGKIELD